MKITLTSRSVVVLLALLSVRCDAGDRVRRGLTALYDFQNSSGKTVHDSSGKEPAADLVIGDGGRVRRSAGHIELQKSTIVRSGRPATRLVGVVRSSGEISVEVWLRPSTINQKGPARIVTISRDPTNRNITLGQEGDTLQVRLRTQKTSRNGLPAIDTPSGTLALRLQHIVYTHAADGRTSVYVDGRRVAEKKIPGRLSNWDATYEIALGNEMTGDRPWLGELHLVAIYQRALTAAEVRQNFECGPAGRPSAEVLAARRRQQAVRHFETVIAPLLADRCMECHDPASREGGLDLSQKATALHGGDGGPVIVPGNAAASPLWAAVQSNSMPLDRPPLSASEKQALKQWIDDGAVWTLSQLDPAIYVHGSTGQTFVRRLTVAEYINTVREVTGVDISKEASELLPPDLRADGFRNTAYNLTVGLKHVDAYRRLAEIIVRRMDVPAFVKRFSSRRKFTDRDMEDVISRVGLPILRGPVTNEEVIAFRGIMTTVASAGGDFDEAMALVLEAMLQSPRFLYRIERQPGGKERVEVSDYELASRMSYMIQGGPPDASLLKSAESGSLSAVDLEEQIDRLLNDPRAVRQSRYFVSDWLNLNHLANLRPNSQRFPDWTPQLADDMREETLQYFEYVAWDQKQPLSSLFNVQTTFATPALARFYGLKPSLLVADSNRYDLSEVSGRGGLLTHGSLLTVGGDNASMVTRGLLILHELLRGVVKDPPPCVNTTPIPSKPGLTQRDIALQRINNAACGGCHSRFEPLAFGLEPFNGVGQWRTKDEFGNRLRQDGTILFPGTAQPVAYNSCDEMMDLLAKSERVRLSLTYKVTQFALGRPLGAADAAEVAAIHETAWNNGGTWSAMMKAIVTSDLVRKTAPYHGDAH